MSRVELTSRPSPLVRGDASSGWVLFIEWRIPMPEHNAGSKRVFHMMEILLERGFNVFWISEADPDHYYKWFLSRPGELKHYEERLDRLGVGYTYGRDAAMAHLREYGSRYGHVIMIYPDVAYIYAPFIRRFCPAAKMIFDVLDLHYLRVEREAKLKKSPELAQAAERYRKIETLLCRTSDAIIAVSDVEKMNIEAALHPRGRIYVIPTIHECEKSSKPFDARKDLVFIGAYLHTPNVDAVKYFISEIFPTIRGQIPDINFLVVGSSIPEELRRLDVPGVRIVGYVDDQKAVFDECRLMVAPLRYGAGVKGKIGSALGYGLPVVTTSIGAEGIGLESGQTAMVADDPKVFADAVIRAYQNRDLWNRLAQNGFHHIEGRMSLRAAAATIDAMMKD